MRTSELMNRLAVIRLTYGDLPILGGYITDDSGVSKVSVLDHEGVEIEGVVDVDTIAGVFIQ